MLLVSHWFILNHKPFLLSFTITLHKYLQSWKEIQHQKACLTMNGHLDYEYGTNIYKERPLESAYCAIISIIRLQGLIQILH